MTKLEELEAAWVTTSAAALDAYDVACDAAWDACDLRAAAHAAYVAARDAAFGAACAYQAELKKTKEQTND
jgi:hypothetical protein